MQHIIHDQWTLQGINAKAKVAIKKKEDDETESVIGQKSYPKRLKYGESGQKS